MNDSERNYVVQKFYIYQVEWLRSHNDIQLNKKTEEMIIRFLHDTANRFMIEECSE